MATIHPHANTGEPNPTAATTVAVAALATILFGLLTLFGLVAVAATYAIGFQQTVDPFVYVGTAVQGLLFLGLGYGVLRRSRSCMWVTLGLTALIVVDGTITAVSTPSGASLFLLLVSPVVVILNYFALRATPKPDAAA